MEMIKSVQKFYKKNRKISQIGILALVISGSYVLTYNMPDYFGIEPIYSFLNNVSISYIAALIFFVVQVYIPEEENKKKSMRILSNQFVGLVEFIDSIILLSEKYFEIDIKGAKILWNDSAEILFVKYSSDEETKGLKLRVFTEKELREQKNVFSRKLKEIKELSVINYCNYEILEKLAEIEKNKFFDILDTVVQFADTDLNFDNFIKEKNSMKILLNEFRILCDIPKYNLSIEDMDDKEKKMMIQAITDVHDNCVSLENINKIMNGQ